MIDDDDEPPNPDDFTDSSPCPATDSDLAALCEQLHERGISKATIRYEGSGDSGCVEEVKFEPANSQVPEALDDKLRDIAESYCPDGYENNDGGYGTLKLFPSLGLAELEHFDRYADSESIDVEAVGLPDELKQVLAQAGVIRVTATFDGCGDSGQIATMTVEPEGIEISDDLRNQLDDFLLDQLPSGWEINEGSFGDFDVRDGHVTVEASWRIEKDSDAQLTQWKWRQ